MFAEVRRHVLARLGLLWRVSLLYFAAVRVAFRVDDADKVAQGGSKVSSRDSPRRHRRTHSSEPRFPCTDQGVVDHFVREAVLDPAGRLLLVFDSDLQPRRTRELGHSFDQELDFREVPLVDRRWQGHSIIRPCGIDPQAHSARPMPSSSTSSRNSGGFTAHTTASLMLSTKRRSSITAPSSKSSSMKASTDTGGNPPCSPNHSVRSRPESRRLPVVQGMPRPGLARPVRSRWTCCCCGPSGHSGATSFGASCTPNRHLPSTITL